MRVYETREIPARTDQVCVRRKCDLCGVESKSSDWNGGGFEVNETEVKMTVKCRTGTNYPDCGWGDEYEIDLCPKCFTDRLVPWLRGEGAAVESKEWDW